MPLEGEGLGFFYRTHTSNIEKEPSENGDRKKDNILTFWKTGTLWHLENKDMTEEEAEAFQSSKDLTN